MSFSTFTQRVFVLSAFVFLLAAVGCGEGKRKGTIIPNEAPFVRITGGPAEGDDASYSARIFWTGWDNDGIVERFEYALDPPRLTPEGVPIFSLDEIEGDSFGGNPPPNVDYEVIPGPAENLDTLVVSKMLDGETYSFRWIQTLDFNRSFVFRTQNADTSFNGTALERFSEAHTVFVRCRDDDGAYSPSDQLSYLAQTQTPVAEITSPSIEAAFLNVGSNLTVAWDGADADSPDPRKKPTGYLFSLLRLDTLDPPRSILNFPNCNEMHRFVGKSGLPDWTYRSADTTEASFFLGVPGQYAFGVRAVDIAEAEEPELECGRNAFLFQAFATGGTPTLTLNEPSCGRFTFRGQDSRPQLCEVARGADLRFNWSGSAEEYGGRIEGYNFGVDIPDLDREGPGSGWAGWGNITENQAPIRFDLPGIHVFYVRVRDFAGGVTTASLILQVVDFPFDRGVLMVDDFSDPGFPGDAQHDMFWEQMVANNTELSPGEFFVWEAQGLQDGEVLEPRELTLAELGRYRTIFWRNSGPGFNGISSLLKMATLRPFLGAYLTAGGQLWVNGRLTVPPMLPSPNRVSADFTYPKTNAITPRTFLYDFMKITTSQINNDKGDRGEDTLFRAIAWADVTSDPNDVAIYSTMTVDKSKLAPAQANFGAVNFCDSVWDPMFTNSIEGFQGAVDSLYAYGAAGRLDTDAFPTGRSSPYHETLTATRWSDTIISVDDEGVAGPRIPNPARRQGRIQWFGFPLYFMFDNEAQTVFNETLRWFREEDATADS